MQSDRIIATYRLRTSAADAARRAQALALEAVADARLRTEVVGDVSALHPQPDGSTLAQVALAVQTVGGDAGQLMNMLFGNSSLLPHLELLDVDVPLSLARHCGGPRHGIDGLRD